MNRIRVLKELGRYPLFTLNDFVRITGNSREYARTCLNRLGKAGLVFRVEKGKYTIHDDPMAFSSHMVVPSYISFWTAIRFYGFTEQLPVDIMLASPKSRKNLEFRGTRIRFFKTKLIWGYGKQRYLDFDIFVADKEKCIIDSLLLRNVPIGEIAKAVSTKDFDAARLVEYAIKTGSASLAKRLGYIMELCGMEAKGLESQLDGNYVRLDWHGRNAGEKDRRWKIIVNRRLSDDIQ